MKLVPARHALAEHILDSTFPVWNEGLTRQAYGQLNAAQVRTPWGAANLERFALVDDNGRLLSTAKRYRLEARLDGRPVRACGLGAVFTPPDLRGRGYARELIERLLQQEAVAGAVLALLFSEIGPVFYQRLGFQPVPIDEITLAVRERDGAPAMLVRAGDASDLPAIASLHDRRSAGVRFALARDPAFVQFSLARKRLRVGLGTDLARKVEFYVAEEGATAVAYVVLTVTGHGWTVDEAGDRDPAGARLGAILQVLLAREPAERRPRIRAWWPRALPMPPQLSVAERRDARDVMMVRSLAGTVLPSSANEVFYWRGDFF